MADPRAQAWLAAASDASIAAALQEIYARAAIEVARHGPVCRSSGRCCNFEKWGHRLYVTGLEAAYTLARLSGPRARAGESADRTLRLTVLDARPLHEAGPLSRAQIDQARAGGGCPFQSGTLCTVHEIKPLGCRVYFCDQSELPWQGELSETALKEIRALHELHAIPYRYAEWRDMLEVLVDAMENRQERS